MAYCQSKGGMPYFECSAKEAINVEQAFEGMNTEALFCQKQLLTTVPNFRSDCPTSFTARRVNRLQPRFSRANHFSFRERAKQLQLLIRLDVVV